uniref:Alternative protein MUC12 n=1 Tax=Homo sapiens TaxID=9606 RepID=L8E898_HUMAN|nr:alternative protein MUC12 [Homo sapiens]
MQWQQQSYLPALHPQFLLETRRPHPSVQAQWKPQRYPAVPQNQASVRNLPLSTVAPDHQTQHTYLPA